MSSVPRPGGNGRSSTSNARRLGTLSTLILLFAFLTFSDGTWHQTMSWLFPSLRQTVYPMASFPQLILEHGVMVLVSSSLATFLGVVAGIVVTRPWGRDFLASMSSLASMGQTFPPVAVLALAVPIVGFGLRPTLIALFLYGLLPVLRNTITGLENIPVFILEAARGMGMTNLQMLRRVELPLAAPVILSGVRISAVINIGTATLGATIGAGGLGKPIIAGLIGENPAYILEGAILVGLLALIVDNLLGMLERGDHSRESLAA